MNVKVELFTTSQPLIFENVTNTYTKDGLFCIYIKSESKVQKIPVINIFRITEDYK